MARALDIGEQAVAQASGASRAAEAQATQADGWRLRALLAPFLDLRDTLERALGHARAPAGRRWWQLRPGGDREAATLAALLAALDHHLAQAQVVPFASQGDPFDPHTMVGRRADAARRRRRGIRRPRGPWRLHLWQPATARRGGGGGRRSNPRGTDMTTHNDPIIGIDLGTTNSVAAIFTARGPEIAGPAPDETDGATTLPSAVGLTGDGALLVGTAARNQAQVAPARTVLSVKRRMGTRERLPMGDRSLKPEEISSLILEALKRRAEAALDGSVAKAVITVPAYFTDAQRQATREAGGLAGLDVVCASSTSPPPPPWPTAARWRAAAGCWSTIWAAVPLTCRWCGPRPGVVEVEASLGDNHPRRRRHRHTLGRAPHRPAHATNTASPSSTRWPRHASSAPPRPPSSSCRARRLRPPASTT